MRKLKKICLCAFRNQPWFYFSYMLEELQRNFKSRACSLSFPMYHLSAKSMLDWTVFSWFRARQKTVFLTRAEIVQPFWFLFVQFKSDKNQTTVSIVDQRHSKTRKYSITNPSWDLRIFVWIVPFSIYC